MPTNFRLVVYTTQRKPRELAPQSARNRLAERSFTHTWRPHKAQDRPLHIRLQAANGEIVQNAVFNLFQVVVIRVQNFLRFGNLDFLPGSFRPGQNGQPLNVVAGE